MSIKKQIKTASEKYQQYKPYLRKANFLAANLLVFWLPLYKEYLPHVIVFWIFTWLIEGDFITKFKSNFYGNKKLIFILSILYYCLHVAGLIYTTNLSYGLYDLEFKLSLLIFPCIFISSNYLYKKHFKYLLYSFVGGTLIASVICLVNAVFNSIGYINGDLVF